MTSFLAVAIWLLPRLHLNSTTEANITWTAVYILPVVIGTRIGLRFPRQGARAAFYATSIVALVAAPVCYWGFQYGAPNMDWGIKNEIGSSSPTAAWYLWQAMIQIVTSGMIWPMTASLAAAVAATCFKVQHHLRITNA